MLKKVNKDLKLTDYTLCHIVTSGFSHFKKLRVTTTEAVEKYIEQIKALKSMNKDAIVGKPLPRPFSKVEILDQNPVLCMI